MTPWRELRRPLVLTVLSVICLVVHQVLLARFAHSGDAHRFLVQGGDTSLVLTFFGARFVAYLLVPGLLLAVLAEVAAFVLVGPRRVEEEEDPD